MTLVARIRNHALAVHPQEACGLIRLLDGSLDLVRCVNQAQNPVEHFKIDPNVYLAARRDGDMYAYYHTHTTGDSTPSAPDADASEALGVAALVYDLPSDTVRSHVPLAARRKPLEARFYLPTVYDCISLFTDYYLQVLKIELPNVPRTHTNGEVIPDVSMMDYASTHDLDPVDATPQEHDVLVMGLGSSRPNHVAVMTKDNRIFHHLRDTYSGYDVYGGYWEQCTRYIFRHKSQQ